MTKQEEIREGAEKVVCNYCDDFSAYPNIRKVKTVQDARDLCREQGKCALCTDTTKAILTYLKTEGVVIKVDRELPHNPWSYKGIRTISGKIKDPTELQFYAYARARKEMSGYEAVEEL